MRRKILLKKKSTKGDQENHKENLYFSRRLEFPFMFFHLNVGKLNLCDSEMRRERFPCSKVINGDFFCKFFCGKNPWTFVLKEPLCSSSLVFLYAKDCNLTEIPFSGCFSQICSKMEIACTHSSSFQIRCTLNQRVHTKLALLDLSKN